VCEKLPFQVRITDAKWLEHQLSIEDLQYANFWTNVPNPRTGERIVFLRGKKGASPRKIAGWGFVHSSGETTPNYHWDSMDSNEIKSRAANSQASSKKCYMILKNIYLLGSREPLENDFFKEEFGLEKFPTSGTGWKNYNVDFPVFFEDTERVQILVEGASIGVKEGGAKYVTHVIKERRATRKFRGEMIEESKNSPPKGKVLCEVCETDMLGKYKVGVPIIDCHHLFPLSDIDEEVVTTKSDLALLCPSCHRAIHQLDDCSNLDELRRRIGIMNKSYRPIDSEPDEIIEGSSCCSNHDIFFTDYRFYCSNPNCKTSVGECPYCRGYLVSSDDFGEYCEAAFCPYSNDYDRCGNMLRNRIDSYTDWMPEMLMMDDPWMLDKCFIENDFDIALEKGIINSKKRLELQQILDYCYEEIS